MKGDIFTVLPCALVGPGQWDCCSRAVCTFDIAMDMARFPHQKSYGHFTPAHCRHLGLEEILGSTLCSHHTDGETESSKLKSFAQDKPVEPGLELLMPHHVKHLLSQCRSLRVGPASPPQGLPCK